MPEPDGPGGARGEARREESFDVNTSQANDEPAPVASFELLRRVLLGTLQAVGDGAELVGASVREELERFRLDLEHGVVFLVLVATGVAGISAGILLLVRQLVGNWPLALFLVGGAHVGAGIWVYRRWQRKRDAM
jgi:hypothetical protein